MVYTPDFERLLRPGATFRAAGGGVTDVIESIELGEAVVPTGRVVGCDPLVLPGADPYTVAVAPGVYPLIAWVAVFYEDGTEQDRRNAGLELRINGAPTVTWEMAVTDPQDDVSELDDDGFYGYCVDAACGTLADQAALHPMTTWEYERTEDVFINEISCEGPVNGLAAAVTDPVNGANVVLVDAGFGDGVYPTFIGRDADGAVTRLVTDFLVLEDKE